MIDEATLDQARQLVRDLEAGNEAEAKKLVDELTKIREAELFRELGKLTRELHDTLDNFRIDPRVADLAEKDIPDAQERLNYVMTMTEQAANKTLTAVEDALPVSEQLQQRSGELGARWLQFRNRELNADEFRELSRALDVFFPQVAESTQILQSNLSDVLLAQDFQDLTGQIIRKVIELVRNVEESLVDLIRIAGKGGRTKTDGKAGAAANIKAEGPQVPGVDDHRDVVRSQDQVDDLLSSLGF